MTNFILGAIFGSIITWLVCANNAKRAAALRDLAEVKAKKVIEQVRK